MKRLLFVPITLASAALILAGFSLISATPTQANADGVASTYSRTAPPTTINLNDVAESDVRDYYSTLNGQNLSGTDLLQALKPILSNGQKYHGYNSTKTDVWKIYEITDRDWTLSPASDINDLGGGTYDPDTGIITGYKYGTGVSNPGVNNPYVHPLYRNRGEEDGYIRAWDCHGIYAYDETASTVTNTDSNGNTNNGFDMEHIWPKSRGFGLGTTPDYGAIGDVLHLWSGDHQVNSNLHSALSYGFVDPSDITIDAADSFSYLDGNYVGGSASFPGGGNVFEPQDCDKGDIARACFYMVARYNNLAGDDTITVGNPNLTLDDTITAGNETSVNSTESTAISIGLLRDLLAWHRLDPVDDYEIHRNNLCYRNFTGNRNPFIDYPDWVEAIWGSVTYDETNHRVCAYSTTPVGVADPENDDVRMVGESWVTLDSIAVSGMTTSFFVGDEFSFDGTVTATYSDASTTDVTSEASFSGFDMGSAGQQTVTVTYEGVTTTYTIIISEPVVDHIVASGMTTTFDQGDAFAFDGTVKAVYDNLAEVDVTSSCTFSGCDMSTVGEQTVTVTYKPASVTYTTTYTITVNEAVEPTSYPLYSLVTDIDELKEGDHVLLVGQKGSSYYALSYQKKNNRHAVELADCDGTSITSLDDGDTKYDVRELTLGITDGLYTFYDETEPGYLYATNSTSNNYLRTGDLAANAKWSLTYDGSAWTITCSDSDVSRNTLMYNSGSTLFSAYDSESTTMIKPLLFKSYVYEADQYGKDFIDTYTANCATYSLSSSDWTQASNAYADLSSGCKNLFKGLDKDGGSAYRYQCVERYDYILSVHGTSPFANFMSRTVTSNASAMETVTSSQSMQVGLLLLLGLAGTGSVTFFLLNRKKKKA